MLTCRANELRSIPSSALDKILREHERQTSLILLRGTCDEHKGLIELPCYLEGYILDNLSGCLPADQEEADAIDLYTPLSGTKRSPRG